MNESFGLESVHFGEDRPVPSTPRALWLLFSRTPEQVTPADADAAEQLASALVPYALESVQAVLAIPDRGEATEEAPDFGHEFGMIVLADRRDWRGFDALLRLLYRSTAWLETVFPSFLVGDGSAIVASFAMGDADRLFELQRLLSDANRPMAYRHLCGSALSKLAFHGALPREELRKIYDAAWDANPGRQFVRFALDPLALSMLGVDWLLGRAARDQVTIDEETLEELRATIRTTQEEHAEKPWLFGPLEKLSDALLRAAFYLDDLVDLEDNEDDEVLDGDGKDYEPLWGAAEDDAASGGEDAESSGDELDHEGCGHDDCDHDHDEPEEVPGFPFVRESPKVGRNDPCPCGSGKKFKKCCG